MKLFTLLFAFFLFPVFSSGAGDKPPPTYTTGKLLDISQVVDNRVVSYETARTSKDSSSVTPIHDPVATNQVVVQVGDIVYTGQNQPYWGPNKLPQWVIGDSVEVRFDEKNHMFLKKPDGKEFRVNIVRKERVGAPAPQAAAPAKNPQTK